jgi:hypothetical protein
MNQAARHSAEAERGVFGSILLSPRQVIPECDNMIWQRMIPFIRARRAVRFCLPRVLQALGRFEIREAGR